MFPNYQGGAIFTQIHLGLNTPFKSVKANISSWLEEQGWGLHKKDLQHPRMENMCWLIYRVPKMDYKYLKEECQRLSNMDWGIRWQTIPGSQPTIDGKRVKALVAVWSRVKRAKQRSTYVNGGYSIKRTHQSKTTRHNFDWEWYLCSVISQIAKGWQKQNSW